MRLLYLFVQFLLSPPGKERLQGWRALRRECLKRAQVGQKANRGAAKAVSDH